MKRFSTLLAIVAVSGCQPPQTGITAGATTTLDIDTGDPADTTGSTPTGTGEPSESTTSGPATTADVPDPTTSGGTTEPVDPTGDDPTGGPWMPRGCPEIYAQDLLPTFEIEIDPVELAALEDEWHEADDDNTPEHPVTFIYDGMVIDNASVRLRGNATWWPTQGKMQLEVSFNTYDKKGRFMGLKHVLFDCERYNRSFLRDRLALQILRDVGLPAPCANNARVVINGEYYGLFTSIEKVDSEFLERVFENPDGNLYKAGGKWKKKTNEDDPDTSDLDDLFDADTIAQLDAMMNLDQALLEWATEAVIPDNDGAWAGGLNLYLYNDPLTGFNIIPWDKDATFERIEHDVDPVTFKKENFKGRPLYELALSDPGWFAKYIQAIERVLETGYDVKVLQQRIDDWSAQIAEAAADDVNKPFTTKQFHDDVEELREFVELRAEFVADWLKCWQDGGTDDNGDGRCDG